MQTVLARVRNPALRQGLMFGIILGVILLALSFILTNFYITIGLIILATFLAGRRASQETGKLTTGMLAGVWTGLLGICIPSLISFALLLINLDAYRKNYQAIADKQHLHIVYTNSTVITGLLINVLILLVLVGALFGAIGGMVGGTFGKRRAEIAPVEEYHEALFEPPSKTEVVEAQREEPQLETQSEEIHLENPPLETQSEEPYSSTQKAE